MAKIKFQEWLIKHKACSEAVAWVEDKSLNQAWNQCKNPQWMMWYLNASGYKNDKKLRLFAVWCARQVRHLMTDPRSINALDVAERYANGKATDEELAAVREAAGAAAREAVREAAGEAAGEAAWAAAREAAWAAAWAAAGAAAWAAAWAEARAAAGEAAGEEQCKQLRKMIKIKGDLK